MLEATGAEAGAVMEVEGEAVQRAATHIPGTVTAKIHAQLLERSGAGLIAQQPARHAAQLSIGIAMILQVVQGQVGIGVEGIAGGGVVFVQKINLGIVVIRQHVGV